MASGKSYDPAIHHRRSIRRAGHDYAGGGIYFVTVCVAKRRPLFGTIINGRMALSEAGRIAASCWKEIPAHFAHVTLDEWVIMPDHMHGTLRIADTGVTGGTPEFGRPVAGSLGAIIGSYKSATSRAIRMRAAARDVTDEPIWQRNYYDIIVRDNRALEAIRRYIRNNPANWDVLRHGEPRYTAGNRALLDLPMTAYLASRSGAMPHSKGKACLAPSTRWMENAPCIVSGFLSPMEREVLDKCLCNKIPAVWILATGLPERFPARVQNAIEQNRLLVMTPFGPTTQGFSAARAAWCNQYVLHVANRAVIGQLAPDGMLACLIADPGRDITVEYTDGSAIK